MNNEQSNKRRNKENGDKQSREKKVLKGVITSLLLIDGEERRSENEEWNEIALQEKTLFEATQMKEKDAMLGYYSGIQDWSTGCVHRVWLWNSEDLGRLI
ncbi:hypothetical protein Droror1_Dr00023799 [Drosera rotundifolia]